jgi:hypothetical protein
LFLSLDSDRAPQLKASVGPHLMMTTTDSILAGFFGVLTLLGVLLLFPRFRKHARWQPGYVPMSLRSRLLFPLFPASLMLGVLGFYSAVGIVLAMLLWVIGFLSYLADYRSHSTQRRHGD